MFVVCYVACATTTATAFCLDDDDDVVVVRGQERGEAEVEELLVSHTPRYPFCAYESFFLVKLSKSNYRRSNKRTNE